ncbi:MAG: NUDIX hydrolase [Lewinella sp.]|nr:NUDIX hydrolase [Lewinella sp.]
MEKNPWLTLDLQVVYNNPWIQVSHRNVINPSGGKGIYGIVHFKNLAVGVIPIDEEDHTWLVGQYRYALGRYSWEIPEGGCPLGDSPLAAAQRELREETGPQAGHWEELLRTDLSNSVTDEEGVIFVARQLSQGTATPEPTEALQLRRLPVQEAINMVLQGEITDALSVMSLLRLAMQRTG